MRKRLVYIIICIMFVLSDITLTSLPAWAMDTGEDEAKVSGTIENGEISSAEVAECLDIEETKTEVVGTLDNEANKAEAAGILDSKKEKETEAAGTLDNEANKTETAGILDCKEEKETEAEEILDYEEKETETTESLENVEDKEEEVNNQYTEAEQDEAMYMELILNSGKITPGLYHIITKSGADELISVTINLQEVKREMLEGYLNSSDSPFEAVGTDTDIYRLLSEDFINRHFDEAERERIFHQGGYSSTIVEKVSRGLLSSYRTVTTYTSTISVTATKSEIVAFVLDDQVKSLSSYGETLLPESTVVLNEAKATAKVELAYYKDMEGYREAQQMEIQELVETGIIKIDSAQDLETIRQILQDMEAQLDKVKTDAQITKEEALGNAVGNIDKDGTQKQEESSEEKDSAQSTDKSDLKQETENQTDHLGENNSDDLKTESEQASNNSSELYDADSSNPNAAEGQLPEDTTIHFTDDNVDSDILYVKKDIEDTHTILWRWTALILIICVAGVITRILWNQKNR